MIDHLTISVTDYEASKQFYTRVLAPLGFKPLMEFGTMVGFGRAMPVLWIKQASTGTQPQHIAFQAGSRAMVDAFHQVAVASGAKDDGAPGLRSTYHPSYYGAFVIDPLNGHPLEAVIHRAPEAEKKPVSKKVAVKSVAKKLAAKKAPAKKKAKPAPKKKPATKAKR